MDCSYYHRVVQYDHFAFCTAVLMNVYSSKIEHAPPNVPLEGDRRSYYLHFEHAFALAGAFIFIFSIFLGVSTFTLAQEFRAQVSATVLPLESYCPKCIIDSRHSLVRWWQSMDTYHKMLIGSGSALAGLMIPLGTFVLIREIRSHRPTFV